VLAGASLTLAGVGPARAAAGSFRRGIGVHSLMNWGATEPGRPNLYTFRPFSGPDYDLPMPLLREVATAGFDFYRLTLDPGPFLQLTGRRWTPTSSRRCGGCFSSGSA
jgi:hypothetical protein